MGEDMTAGFLRRQSHADNKVDVSRRPQANPSSPPYGGDKVLSVGNLAVQPSTFSVGG